MKQMMAQLNVPQRNAWLFCGVSSLVRLWWALGFRLWFVLQGPFPAGPVRLTWAPQLPVLWPILWYKLRSIFTLNLSSVSLVESQSFFETILS